MTATNDNLPTRAQLKAWLARAEREFILARYIDSTARMLAEQERYAAQIKDYKGRLARLEYRDVAA